MYLILFSVAVVLICTVLGARQTKRRRKQFPPISNQEFLERCTPGTNPYIALKVRRILSESLGVEYERIYPESRLLEDLGAE